MDDYHFGYITIFLLKKPYRLKWWWVQINTGSWYLEKWVNPKSYGRLFTLCKMEHLKWYIGIQVTIIRWYVGFHVYCGTLHHFNTCLLNNLFIFEDSISTNDVALNISSKNLYKYIYFWKKKYMYINDFNILNIYIISVKLAEILW
jgi:hypothetical protein